MKRWLTLFSPVAVVLLLSIAGFGVDPSFVEQWKSFRSQHPYHVQIIGLSQPDTSQHRLLLVAEPPPHVIVSELKNIDAARLSNIEIGRTGVGVNGWLKDILVELPPMSEPDLELLIDKLHSYLFGTSYKATAVPISGPDISKAAYKLDLRVPAGNIASALLATETSSFSARRILLIMVLSIATFAALVTLARSRKPASVLVSVVLATGLVAAITVSGSPSHSFDRFSPAEGGALSDLKTILKQGTSGVFLSETPGVVAWSFPRSQPLSNYQLEARKFSLDSDLILGAIANSRQVAVIARERVVPVDMLPPLRSETVMLLASAGTDELAQSYERNNVFAGKFDQTNNLDWAPIYLSPQLINTEYGSLLNVTDQLLKSWSEKGQIEYVNFKYAKPDHFPFPEPLNKYVKAREITFNWNTKGAGYSISKDGFEIFALNRTGALPVDYLAQNNEQLKKAEDDGYDYFAGRNDPNLVRVVQYAALYQIFRRFGVSAPATAHGSLGVPQSLKASALILLNVIAAIPDDAFTDFSSRLDNRSDQVEADEMKSDLEGIQRDRHLILDIRREFGEDGIDLIAACIAAPRSSSPVSNQAMQQFQAAKTSAQREAVLQEMSASDKMGLEAELVAQRIVEHRHILQLLSRMPLAAIKKAYVEEFEGPESSWIGTPTIVESWATGSLAGSIGGHNIDAPISVFRSSDEVPTGQVQIKEENGDRVVLHNPQDTGRVSQLVRAFGRENGQKNDAEVAADLNSILKASKPPKNIPLGSILEFRDGVKPSPLRGLDQTMARNTLDHSGYRPTYVQTTPEQRALSDLISSDSHRAVVVEKLQGTDTYVIIQNSTREIFEAHDLASAQDAVTACLRRANFDGKQVRVHLRGFDVRQGNAFMDSAEFKAGESKPAVVARIIDEGRLTSSELSNILRNEYDFQKASIDRIGVIEQDENGAHIDIDATVPTKSSSKPPLLIRIRVWFQNGLAVTQEAINAIVAKVKDFVVRLAPGTEGIIDPVTALASNLRKIHPGVNLDVRYSRENKDIHMGYDKPIPFREGEAGKSA